MAHRYTPYGNSQPAGGCELWIAHASTTHPLKGNENNNADVAIVGSRYMGVFDGVSGVSSIGLSPAAMSNDLAVKVSTEMEDRLDRQKYTNAQTYDRDIQLMLKSSVRPNDTGTSHAFF
jgi:hypothetical protein